MRSLASIEEGFAAVEDGRTNDIDSRLKSELEGSPKQIYTTVYERKKNLRIQAIAIHGESCVACGFNFGSFYGEYASGYIQIHHTSPVSEYEKPRAVDPEKELVPLCANCHAVVHRRKDRILSVRELQGMITKANSNQIRNLR